MGSRVQKIAFLVFALTFVAIMAVLNTSINTLGTSANEQLTSIVASDDASLSVYDDSTVYGATVINCAKNPDAICANALTITVTTGSGTATYKSDVPYNVTEPSDGNFINRNAKFHSTLVPNDNGVITGITLVQE